MYKKFIPLIIAAILLSYIGISNAVSPRSTFISTVVVKQTELPQSPILENTNQSSQKTICIGGDVNLAEAMADHIAKGLKPFAGLTEITKNCDLFIVNLETNVADANVGQRQQKNYAFKAPPSTLQVLVDASVDIVSLANNHTKDYGAAALVDQFKHLDNYGIAYVGAGHNINEAFQPLVVDIGGLKIGLIALNDAETRIGNAGNNLAGSAFFDAGRTAQAISTAKALGDIIIVMPHWGIEHQTKPSSRQIQWGHTFIDQGADIVLGAHPHVRQNIEEYKGKKIYYSLGNFVFSGFADRAEAQKSLLIKIKIENGKIVGYEDIQLQLNFEGFPTPI